MKQYIKELIAICLFIISVLWSFGTAGAIDSGNIGMGQGVIQLVIGIAMLCIATILINTLSGKEEARDVK